MLKLYQNQPGPGSSFLKMLIYPAKLLKADWLRGVRLIRN